MYPQKSYLSPENLIVVWRPNPKIVVSLKNAQQLSTMTTVTVVIYENQNCVSLVSEFWIIFQITSTFYNTLSPGCFSTFCSTFCFECFEQRFWDFLLPLAFCFDSFLKDPGKRWPLQISKWGQMLFPRLRDNWRFALYSSNVLGLSTLQIQNLAGNASQQFLSFMRNFYQNKRIDGIDETRLDRRLLRLTG